MKGVNHVILGLDTRRIIEETGKIFELNLVSIKYNDV